MKVVVGLGCGRGVCGSGVCGSGVCDSGVCGSVLPGIASLDSVGIVDWGRGVSSGTSSNKGSKEASERTSDSTTIGCKLISCKLVPRARLSMAIGEYCDSFVSVSRVVSDDAVCDFFVDNDES